MHQALLCTNVSRKRTTRGAKAARLGAQNLKPAESNSKIGLRKGLKKKAVLGVMIGISLLNPLSQAFADTAPILPSAQTTQQVQGEQTSVGAFSLFNLQLNETGASSVSDGGIHHLQAGETLGQVAVDNDITLADLLAANPKNEAKCAFGLAFIHSLKGGFPMPSASWRVSVFSTSRVPCTTLCSAAMSLH
ncbi:MAG: LysM peptidoglycan-binding domain-containing protein [Deltaproteobacteria bacterium]|nr:LysM peptidoglycan-binding domain-containing protein [Deltaproteobacteria bacterium]